MSNIKINDVFQRIQYSATNAQTQFAIPFPFFSNAYVYVWQDGIQIFQGGGASQYGITGAGSPSGGQITLVTPATTGSIITIEGIMPIDRTSIYSATISNLTGSDLNGDFNREVVMMKQIETTQALLQLQYAPWALVSQDQTVTKDRYIPLLPALGAWRMNAGGTAIETFLTPASGGLAPDDAEYILQTANSDLPNGIALDQVASGYLVNQLSTGLVASRVFQAVVDQTVVTNGNGNSGNTIYGIAPNPILPGTGSFIPPSGTTAERPVTPVEGMVRFNTDLSSLEIYDNGDWDQLSGGVVDTVVGTLHQIDVDNTDAENPILSLSATLNLPGTFNIQSSTAISGIINDSTMATASATNISTSLALKTYIDALVTGLNIQGSCVCASTAALTATYANGASGVGATLTNADTQAAISLDGVSPTVGQRVLIKNQAAPAQNGIYTVTVVGTVSTNWVLTRATDYDTSAEIQKGDLVLLTGGTTQNGSSWVQTTTVVTVGTDAVTFIQFTASLPVGVANGGTGATSFTAYAPIVGGTTTTSALQSVTLGAAGTLFRSNGVGALPGFTTATYPSAAGALNNVLTSDGTNWNSTALPSAFITLNAQTFIASGTYTPTAGMKYCIIELVGGGGGGGGCATGGGSIYVASAGGGAGGYAKALYTAAQIGASKTVTIGAAGTAGTAGATTGGAGGTTSVGSLISSVGGGGGGPGTTSSSGEGGAGGNPTVSSGINMAALNGMPGCFGYSNGAGSMLSSGGNGGTSPFGGGGLGKLATSVGSAGNGYGSGGSGASTLSATSAGSAGTGGYVLVTEYI